MEKSKKAIMSVNDMSSNGLIYLINKEVLHPLGLALMRDPKNNTLIGGLIDQSGDMEWEYVGEIIETNEVRLENFMKNREEILTKIISDLKKDTVQKKTKPEFTPPAQNPDRVKRG